MWCTKPTETLNMLATVLIVVEQGAVQYILDYTRLLLIVRPL